MNLVGHHMEFKHYSVLYNETLQNLLKQEGIYVDATVGGGGHSFGIVASKLCKKLYCFDQDEEAINAASKRLESFSDKVFFIHSNFENIKYELELKGVHSVSGIVADLGVSSYQLDNAQRGFSYMKDAILDMRMDKSADKSAYDIVNYYTQDELAKIFKIYGEERFSQKIAQAIVAQRPIKTTLELVDVIRKAIPRKFQDKKSHPAKRVFQAIRIELNREIEILEKSITDMVDLLESGGRICVITFHSLEDRIIKHIFRELENPCTCPSNFPMCICNKESYGKVITKKPILPTEQELNENSRSSSAKLRVFERK